LEHSRILVFGAGTKEQVFLSSADWMPRNFDRRVEAMFPVESEPLRRRIVEEIIPTYLSDDSRMRMLRADGKYMRVATSDDMPRRSQSELLRIAASRAEAAEAEESAALSFDALSEVIANGEPQRDGQRRKKKKRSAAR
jgi:polyphosphate kinase